MPEIELPSFVQQRPLYVLLQDVGFIGPVTVSLFSLEDALDLIELQTDYNPIPAIGVLARFDDPRIEPMNRLRVVLVVLGNGIVMLQKLEVFIVLEPVLDVEGQRQKIKHLFPLARVVFRHGLEEGFFVAEHEVVAEMVVDLDLGFYLWMGVLDHAHELASGF